MKKFKFKIHGTVYNVNIDNVEGNIADVDVNGTTYKVELENEPVKPSKTPTIVRPSVTPSTDYTPAPPQQSKSSSPKKNTEPDESLYSVKSPLPGIILAVKVKEGDKVEEGAPLVILEAMKMENNINSDKSGTVKKIHIAINDSVLEGDVLIEIEA